MYTCIASLRLSTESSVQHKRLECRKLAVDKQTLEDTTYELVVACRDAERQPISSLIVSVM